jgi:heme exporter protein A
VPPGCQPWRPWSRAAALSCPAVGVRVEFQRITKRFDARRVLSGVSGAFAPGRVLIVTGANGTGKSTLLNILSGIMRPSNGTVRYLDQDRELPRAEWFSHLGVAAPDMAVYEELSAIENLRFFAHLRRLRDGEHEISTLLGDLGLAPADQRRRVGTYSSGMRQRVKLAQAVLHRPAVLLLDEPSSNLDTGGHEIVAGVVRRFRAEAAVAVATNDPREMAWGDERIELGV